MTALYSIRKGVDAAHCLSITVTRDPQHPYQVVCPPQSPLRHLGPAAIFGAVGLALLAGGLVLRRRRRSRRFLVDE
jgi:LPXTG-motif cell wall-anchored protein